MRIARAPPRTQHLPDVRLAVAVGVLEKQDVRRLRHDHAAVGEGEAGRDIEMVREDGDLVGAAVAVCVLEDLDPVVAQSAA